MKDNRKTLARLPGWVASVLMIFFSSVWTYWGIAEMYHEGWWGAWYNRLPYLVPILVTLGPTLLAFRWPIVGGIVIAAIGVFALFFFDNDVAFIGLAIAVLGGAFLVDGVLKRRAGPEEAPAPVPWWRRHWRYRLALGIPAIIVVIASAVMLPVVLTRVDDGDRGIRTIEGNGLTLVWAPEGPGWNWQQSWGGYPSWQDIALYGVPPVGMDDKPGYGWQEGYETVVFASGEDMIQTNLCRYLSADGTALLSEVQDSWRMPTTDELVRSLGRHGENAGCVWEDEFRVQVACETKPDKESPLWSTDLPVIYYWTADAYSERQGYFVAYNGTVSASYKLGGNPRHGYRCVKDP